MSSDVEKLKAARELIARPGGWTQEVFCRWPDGRTTTDYGDVAKDAVCFCAEGAMIAAGIDCQTVEMNLFDDVLGEEFGDIPTWNDAPGRTQAEVVRAFDDAIAQAEAAHV